MKFYIYDSAGAGFPAPVLLHKNPGSNS